MRRGEIGVHAQTITPLLAEALGLAIDSGVILSDVTPGGPAARAGLQAGDLVQALDGKPMENGRQFRINVYARGAGEQVMIEVRRGDRALSLTVPVAERPSDSARLEELIGPQQAIANLGITVLDLTPVIAQLLPSLRRGTGAVIARVAPDAPFSQQGKLAPGDVVYALNGKPIHNAADLRAAAVTLKPASPCVLQVERESGLLYVAFRIEK